MTVENSRYLTVQEASITLHEVEEHMLRVVAAGTIEEAKSAALDALNAQQRLRNLYMDRVRNLSRKRAPRVPVVPERKATCMWKVIRVGVFGKVGE